MLIQFVDHNLTETEADQKFVPIMSYYADDSAFGFAEDSAFMPEGADENIG